MAERVVIDASMPDAPARLTADVAVIGTGAGGGIAAEVLARAGLDVLLVEQGGYYRADDFSLREREAYADLYAEKEARAEHERARALRAPAGGGVGKALRGVFAKAGSSAAKLGEGLGLGRGSR